MTYGLIGKTLVHSYSKEIHEALGEYEYNLFSLSPEEMPEFIKARNFRGLNVTIPYKKDVMPLCDEISELAQNIGAVNTLYMKNGKLIGHNTDYEGFLYALHRAGIKLEEKNVLILGSGGTSLMARYAVQSEKAAKIFIASRSGGNKSENDVNPNHVDNCNIGNCSNNHDGDRILTVSYDQLPDIADSIDVIVNTTPVGTFPNNLKQVISLKDFPNCRAVMDVIYNPFKTKLLLEAEKLGLKYSNGLPMLVAQATAAAGYFLGKPGAFEAENERIISAMENRMKNIVLIGMPGCGKSTLGKIISKITEKTFVDMDEEIEKEAGMTIPEIFEAKGESGFRELESYIAEKLGKERGLIIATGGGAILREKNVDALKQNGLILHIERPVETLATKGRPLSQNLDTLKKMEAQRLPLYKDAADITFNNAKLRSKSELAAEVKELLNL